MNYQSTLKKVKSGGYDYIYLYFKHKGKIIRVNTGNKFIVGGMTKELLYNSKVEGYKDLNDKTKKLKQKVDDYLRHKLVILDDINLNQRECITYIEKGSETLKNYRIIPRKQITKSKGVNDYLNEFYLFKKVELSNRPSYKDYQTFTNSLTDFQKYYKTTLTFDILNTIDFLVKYRNFLTIDRGKDYKKLGYLTRGGLNDNTIHKRISEFKTFLLWIENKDLFTFKKSVLSYSVPKYDNEIIVLNNDDIKQLLELEIENKTWKQIRDLFVFNCFVGLRISDLKTLTMKDFVYTKRIKKDKEGNEVYEINENNESIPVYEEFYTLIKENQKTGFKVEVPMIKTSLDILLKYDFNLPKFSDQHFNRELKKILEHYELFPELVVKKRRSNKVNEDKEYMKRELITSHTCRKSFITLLMMNDVPLPVIMKSSGHKKIQTLQKHYVQLTQDRTFFERIDLK